MNKLFKMAIVAVALTGCENKPEFVNSETKEGKLIDEDVRIVAFYDSSNASDKNTIILFDSNGDNKAEYASETWVNHPSSRLEYIKYGMIHNYIEDGKKADKSGWKKLSTWTKTLQLKQVSSVPTDRTRE